MAKAMKMNSMMESMSAMLSRKSDRDTALFILRAEVSLPSPIYTKLAMLLRSSPVETRLQVIRILAAKKSVPPKLDRDLFALLDSKNKKVRIAVAEALFSSRIEMDPKSIKPVFKCLRKTKYVDALGAALAQLTKATKESPELRDLIDYSLKCKDEQVLTSAIQFVGQAKRMANRSVLSQLKKIFLSDGRPLVRLYSAIAIGNYLPNYKEVEKYKDGPTYLSDLEQSLDAIGADLSQVDAEPELAPEAITSVVEGDRQTAGRLFEWATQKLQDCRFTSSTGSSDDQKEILQKVIAKFDLGLMAYREEDRTDSYLIEVYCNIHLANLLIGDRKAAERSLQLATQCYSASDQSLVCMLSGEFALIEEQNVAKAVPLLLRGFVLSKGRDLMAMRFPEQILSALGRTTKFLEDIDGNVGKDADIVAYAKAQSLFESATAGFAKYNDQLRDKGQDARKLWVDSSKPPAGQLVNTKVVRAGLDQLQSAWGLLPEPKLIWPLTFEIASQYYIYSRELHEVDKAIEFALIADKIQSKPPISLYLFDVGKMYFDYKKDNVAAARVFKEVRATWGTEPFEGKRNAKYLKLIS